MRNVSSQRMAKMTCLFGTLGFRKELGKPKLVIIDGKDLVMDRTELKCKPTKFIDDITKAITARKDWQALAHLEGLIQEGSRAFYRISVTNAAILLNLTTQGGQFSFFYNDTQELEDLLAHLKCC